MADINHQNSKANKRGVSSQHDEVVKEKKQEKCHKNTRRRRKDEVILELKPTNMPEELKGGDHAAALQLLHPSELLLSPPLLRSQLSCSFQSLR